MGPGGIMPRDQRGEQNGDPPAEVIRNWCDVPGEQISLSSSVSKNSEAVIRMRGVRGNVEA
jgi:hypothetical protein